jgi:hypothetical protein
MGWLASPEPAQNPGMGVVSPPVPPGGSIVPQVQLADIRAGAQGKNFQTPPQVPDQFSNDPPGAPPPHPPGTPAGLPAGEDVNTSADAQGDPPGWGHYKGIITDHENDKRDPYLGWGDTDLRGYPLSPTGFPMWPGKPGPQGNSTAAGLWQIEKSTWDPIAARLGIHDFSEASQEAVAKEIYRERGLQPWAAFNPKLAQAVGYQPQMADYWNHKAEGAIGAEMGIAQSTAAGMSAKMKEYERIANSAAPGSKEADQALADLRKEAAADRAEYRKRMMTPPVEKPVDAWANFGSLASVVGLLGGLLTRQHITGSLNAAGTAMQAINSNNHEQFKQAFETWHTQTEMAHTLFQMDQEDIHDILTDKRMSIDEKTARLATLSTELGMIQKLGDTLASPYEHFVTLAERRATAASNIAQAKFQTEEATKNYFYQSNIASGMKPDEAMADAIRRSKGLVIPGAAGKPEDIVAVDKDGKEIYKGKATYDHTTRLYTPVGRSEALPAEATINHAPAASGNRVQPQIQRLLGAGSQMEAHLTNLSEMPIGGSIGAFMGVENRAPDELSEGLKRTAMRKLFSSDEIKAMQNEFIGVGRQIAALDAQGAATGLVGLSKQAEGYAPLPDDSPVIVMRKYASLRQIVEQAMKGVLLSGTANPDQKAGAKEIIEKAQAAIPYTVHDVNQIQFGGEKGSTDAAVEIINRRRRELAFDELLKHKDDPAYRESFEKHFGKEALDRALGNGQ